MLDAMKLSTALPVAAVCHQPIRRRALASYGGTIRLDDRRFSFFRFSGFPVLAVRRRSAAWLTEEQEQNRNEGDFRVIFITYFLLFRVLLCGSSTAVCRLEYIMVNM